MGPTLTEIIERLRSDYPRWRPMSRCEMTAAWGGVVSGQIELFHPLGGSWFARLTPGSLT